MTHKPKPKFTAAAMRHAADILDSRVGVHLAKASEAEADDMAERARVWRKTARRLQRDANAWRAQADELDIERMM